MLSNFGRFRHHVTLSGVVVHDKLNVVEKVISQRPGQSGLGKFLDLIMR